MQGLSAVEMAAQLGVAVSTVKAWRMREDYKAAILAAIERTNARIIDKATDVRLDALRLIDRTLRQAHSMIDEAERADPQDEGDPRRLSADAIGKLAKVGLDAYKTTCAQTGIAETTKVDVAVSAPEEARRLLHSELAAMSPDELRALRAKREG